MLKEQSESKVSWNIQSSIETLEDKIEKNVSRSRKIKGKLEKYKKKNNSSRRTKFLFKKGLTKNTEKIEE